MPYYFCVPNSKAAYIDCGSNEILICCLPSAIVWQQRHTCDIAVGMCMLVSACMSVEFLWVMGLAEARYTGINTGLLVALSQ